jgi:hypothetical protein
MIFVVFATYVPKFLELSVHTFSTFLLYRTGDWLMIFVIFATYIH